MQETLKSVIAQYNASQLLTMREVCSCLKSMHIRSRVPSLVARGIVAATRGFLGSIHAVQVVSRDIRTLLTARAKYFNLLLDDVSITNLTFSREYTGAVEAKQVAQQESERAKFIVSLFCHCSTDPLRLRMTTQQTLRHSEFESASVVVTTSECCIDALFRLQPVCHLCLHVQRLKLLEILPCLSAMGLCRCAGGEGRAGKADSHCQGARRGVHSSSQYPTLSLAA